MKHGKYIQEANRKFFNVLGLRLVESSKGQYTLEEDNSPGSLDGCLLQRVDKPHAAQVEREWNEKAYARQGRLGFTIQPVDYVPTVKKSGTTAPPEGKSDGK